MAEQNVDQPQQQQTATEKPRAKRPKPHKGNGQNKPKDYSNRPIYLMIGKDKTTGSWSVLRAFKTIGRLNKEKADMMAAFGAFVSEITVFRAKEIKE